MRRIHVIINPASGQDQPVLAILNRQLGGADIEWSHSVSKAEGDIGRLAEEAVAKQAYDVLAVYGGDGTVSEAASVVKGRAPIAILPGGTGNVISAELGIPQDLEEAVAGLAEGRWPTAEVDALEVDGRRYYLRVGVGADARMIAAADREEKNRLGWLAYLRSALAEAWEGETARFQIEIDGESKEFDAVTVVVANISRIGRGGFRVGESIDPTDGHADVLVVRRTDILAWKALGSAFLGTIDEPNDEDPPLLHFRAREEVKITTTPPQIAHGDGDLIGETPMRIKVVRCGARILCPGRDAV